MKNHIILAMSTLPATINETTFTFIKEDGEEIKIEKCRSQLEPIPRLMMQMSDANDEFIIYALCSTATKVKPDRIIEVINSNEKVNVSAWEYFESRINDYNNNIKYEVIDMDDLSNPYQAIAEVIKKVRENYEDGADRLWVDTHGGLRDVAQIFSALISLLKVDNIVPKEILGVEYGKNLIVSQKEAFSIFEYVSGMNDFIHFGSAKVLKEYYKGKENKNVEEILKAMDEIAAGTQLCDPSKYTKGIKDLRESIQNIDNEPLLGIFAEYIKRDYGEVLIPTDSSKENAEIPPLAIIERCSKKGLYQQALTFMESMMPDEYVKKRCIYTNDWDIVEKENRKDYISKEHFIFDKYACTAYKKGKGKSINQLSHFYSDYAKEYKANKQVYFEKSPIEFKMYDKLIRKYIINYGEKIEIELKTDLSRDKLKVFLCLLQIHYALKQCRNLFNHSNGTRPEIDDIKNVLELYIIFAKYVLQESDR